ncbi:MAG: Gfo/Idh/MocA family oxidoreductase [Gemmatimonadales bacterium]|nr:Gfo/Idh/MocA family oxidoreductase [Gemmatimonadales bacterium]
MKTVSVGRTGRFERFCIVGLGNHALTKLVPALVANGQEVVGVVTRQPGGISPPASAFSDIDTALADLPADTVFVVATPPSLHFDQAMRVIEAGRDAIIEKPAFLSGRDASEAIAASTRRGTILVEGFMHRYAALYRRFLGEWAAGGEEIEAINAVFMVPGMPAGTFRQKSDIASSGLYDIGCYPVSLLTDLGLPLDELTAMRVDFPGEVDREAVRLSGWLNGVRVDIRTGIDAAYANRVSLTLRGGEEIRFSPFFYGRAGDRTISRGSAAAGTAEVVHDADAFQAMFAVTRSTWLSNQAERNRLMVESARSLERLGEELAGVRSSAG